MSLIPALWGSTKRKISVQPKHKALCYLKITNNQRAGRVAQVTKDLPGKHGALHSTPNPQYHRERDRE
jgi:hypothetical protein